MSLYLEGGTSMNVWLFLALMCGLLIALVLILFWHPQRSRTKASTRADRWPTSTIFRDDDRYWSGGIFYNNPDDPAVFVPKRYGLGWTVNFGHPQGKLVLIGTLLLPLVLLILNVLFFGTAPIGCHPSGCYPFP
jgi:uncharacterized membrane protein